jgi:single-stranded-DNA-specific exonuclease
MEKKGDLNSQLKFVADRFLSATKDKEIFVVSHFDTDGITSATIMIKTLKKLDKSFSVKIIKSLEPEFIDKLPKDKVIIFLDLASGSLNHFANSGIEEIFVIDHHEVVQEVPENVHLVNPEIFDKEKISGSGVTYLFCKELHNDTSESAKLAILGMIGDMLDKEIDQLNHNILNEGDIQRKRGLLIYPSTRPLNRTLEFSSDPYIPEVTGNIKGVLELLRECGLNPDGGKYKSLIELTEEEMAKLVTAIMLRHPETKNREIIGDIFLLKFFSKLEDARELSAMINACSRFGKSEIAIQFLMELPSAKKKAEAIHIKYKQLLISGIKYAKETEKIEGKGFTIINAKDNIKDTMIGTVASILSYSNKYEEGTIITALAYYEDKIKVSLRNVGRNGRNVREVLANVVEPLGGEVGGHQFAAGCIIKQEQEQEFIDKLKRSLEIELVKI